MNIQRLKKSIKEHEGLELKPYRCTEGKLTIGFGRNLEDNGITYEEAEFLLIRDLQKIQNTLRKYIDYDKYPSHVQEVLLEMAYQIGINGLRMFKKTIALLNQGNYIEASKEMLNSKWARQTPKRAQTLSRKMRGEF